MTDIARLDAVAMVERFRAGTLSPVEVTTDILARIDRFEPEINAFLVVGHKEALKASGEAEARYRAGMPVGPLDGVPVTIKDNLAVAGWPNRRGSAISDSAPAKEDCPVAEKLRAAGCVILGKTTMPEYGWKGTSDSPLSGNTRNPWDIAKTTGGSSSGAVAAAALNLGAIHIGTDGAGSIRIPAGFTGVFGIKPTYGHVPASPISTMGFLAHLGPLTRTVRDAALAMNVIGRPDSRDMTATLPIEDYLDGLEAGVKGLRIAYSPKLGLDVEVHPDIANLVREAVETFARLGAEIVEADPGFADPIAPLMTLWAGGAALALKGIPASERAKMDPGLVAVAEMGEGISAAEYVDALLYQRNALAARMAAFHARHDLLLSPTLPLPAFEAGRLTPAHGRYGEDWTRWTPFTYPFNLTQQPAASIPCGLTAEGLPAGLQIIGAFGADRLVLRAARAYEAVSAIPRLSAPRKSGRNQPDYTSAPG